MKKLFLLATLTFTFHIDAALAVSKLKFLPLDRNFILNVVESDITGAQDDDAVRLYSYMNVPEQQTSMGTGKSIKTALKDFNFVCAKEKKTCSIVLNTSARTRISGQQKVAQFQASGDEAFELFKLFKPNVGGEFLFISTDQVFRISARPEHFIFEVVGSLN